MATIYHITTEDAWDAAEQSGGYVAESLDTEGFIHLSKRNQIVNVANVVYKGRDDLILLMVDTEKLDEELKYEGAAHPDPDNPVPVADDELFPHLYGVLNLEAVTNVVPFPCNDDGTFTLPEDLP